MTRLAVLFDTAAELVHMTNNVASAIDMAAKSDRARHEASCFFEYWICPRLRLLRSGLARLVERTHHVATACRRTGAPGEVVMNHQHILQLAETAGLDTYHHADELLAFARRIDAMAREEAAKIAENTHPDDWAFIAQAIRATITTGASHGG